MNVPTCHPEAPYYTGGVCKSCYMRQWRLDNPDKVRANKKASYYRHLETNQAKARVKYQANRVAIIARVKAWNIANPGRAKASALLRNYGITAEDYRDHLVGQAGQCLVCWKVPDRDLVVDHDHRTGQFRGLICHHCNRALGHLRDNPAVARRAARYLEHAA